MSTQAKTKITSRTELRRRIAALETHVEDAKREAQRARDEARLAKDETQRWKDQWIEETQKVSQGLAAKMENDRLEQREKLVALIASNKNLEAIDFLLTAQVMLFKIDVRFADDNSRNKAREEMFDSVKGVLIEQLDKMKLAAPREASNA
jgi:outer membrane murein-binding lipoprotein Lpp